MTKPLAVTTLHRAAARTAIEALRRALADPTTAGEKFIVHVDLSRPRRGLWLTQWANLPGLTLDASRKKYQHALLPGWEYSVQEMQTEMIQDLENLATNGERPKVATS